MIDAVTVVAADDAGAVLAYHVPNETPAGASWQLLAETGERHEGRAEATPARVGALAAGRYLATTESGAGRASATLLVRPPAAYLPAAFAEGGRAWGFACNLYALRSERNWGIGDFTDLATFFAIARRLGADAVGLNPLHALHYADPAAASPYSPTSRFFLNPWYVDVEAAPEFERCSLSDEIRSAAHCERRAALRALPFVDYVAVAALKAPAFESCYAALLSERTSPARRRAFEAFCAAGGERLERFARYEALTERFARDDGGFRGWQRWPEAYRRPETGAVERFASEERTRIGYFQYLQFLASEQLARAAREAASMRVGLYADLAVGVDLNSADVWAHQDRYVLEETIGAPPDPLARHGQNWGLPPLDAEALRREGCATYVELFRANMRHAGALRIDHVMSLLRLFRIPAGRPASEGAYVGYPFDELVATLAIESARARCLVVGEDLGTVPDGFRERMERERVLSYRLLLFERGADGRFLSPEAYPELGLATATTHDLPPLAGWITARDIALRERIGLLGADDAARERNERRVEASALLDALRAAGELDGERFRSLHDALDRERLEPGHLDADGRAELARAAYRFLARSRSRFVLVQLDDALGETEQVNLPGTFAEYPNWRRKVGVSLGTIAADARIARLAGEVRERVGGS